MAEAVREHLSCTVPATIESLEANMGWWLQRQHRWKKERASYFYITKNCWKRWQRSRKHTTCGELRAAEVGTSSATCIKGLPTSIAAHINHNLHILQPRARYEGRPISQPLPIYSDAH